MINENICLSAIIITQFKVVKSLIDSFSQHGLRNLRRALIKFCALRARKKVSAPGFLIFSARSWLGDRDSCPANIPDRAQGFGIASDLGTVTKCLTAIS